MEYEEMLKRAVKNLPEAKPASRFEMPRAIIHPAGKSTAVRNFADISKALRRDAADIAKFLFKELGVSGDMKGSELVLNGKVSESMVSKRIEDYVKEYVLCRECGKPDTDIKKDRHFLTLKCQACGAKRSFK
ncbi:MAG: translation initiation factor IF-2 subunit beta [Candidatus Aenigmarchaeota archaeon]|nr:translation initiation factor IF-2 subunit beta [Candidatus Aenigmarchaeota archaeon]MDI6722213.1 translation initiation factor IF-2 subunit beta [Candidatus Aenigmarchaeota archaeon]